MVDQSINALLARGVGPAMVEGAHAGYYQSKTQQEADAERRRLEAEPDIAPALQGDKAAFGRVAAKDPKSAALLSTEMGRLGTAERQKHLDAIEWSGRWADALLKASPSERPAMWQAMRQQGTQLGHDLTGTPENYDPSLEPTIRTIRNTAPTYVKNQQAIDLKKTPPGKAAGVGGGGSGEVWGGAASGGGGAVPSSESGAPGDQIPGTAPMPTGGPQLPAGAVPPGAAPLAQPVQAGPVAAPAAPPGWQAMGHRDPQGNLVPAMMDGKPVYRNVQTGELTSQPPAAKAAPPEPVPASSSGSPGEGGIPGGALPPGVQVAELGDRKAPKVVFDNPGERGGFYGERPGTHGKMEIITGPGGGTLYKMPDGKFEEWRPDLKPPKTEKPAGPAGPFAGASIEGQFANILQGGNLEGGRTDTPEYALAYQHFAKPRTTVDEKGQPITIPGMDMSVFKKPTFNANPDATPAPRAEVGAPIPGAAKAPNTEQSRDIGFSDRMNEANRILSTVDTQGADVKGRFREWGTFLGGNYLQSKEYQSFQQARDNFINAQLRRESGAAINKDEYVKADRQYFPQPGDGPDVIQQKARNRQIALEAMEKSAGPSYKRSEAPAPAGNKEDLKKKYGLD